MIEAVYFDLRDTLVTEEAVIFDSSGQAITAGVIEGAFEVLEAISKDGDKVVAIATVDSTGAQNIWERSVLG